MNRAETVGTAVRQELETLVSDRVIRGFSLAFVDREQAELSYHGVMGAMAPYSSRPVEKGLFYDLASLSKVVGTASRILQLA